MFLVLETDFNAASDLKLSENLKRIDEILNDDITVFEQSMIYDLKQEIAAIEGSDSLNPELKENIPLQQIEKKSSASSDSPYEVAGLQEEMEVLCVTSDVLAEISKHGIRPQLSYAIKLMKIFKHCWKKSNKADEILLLNCLLMLEYFSNLLERNYRQHDENANYISLLEHKAEMEIGKWVKEILRIWGDYESKYLKSMEFLKLSISFFKSIKSLKSVFNSVFLKEDEETLDFEFFNLFLEGILNISAALKENQERSLRSPSNNGSSPTRIQDVEIADLVVVFDIVMGALHLESTQNSESQIPESPGILVAA